jgi:hypothetical protein
MPSFARLQSARGRANHARDVRFQLVLAPHPFSSSLGGGLYGITSSPAWTILKKFALRGSLKPWSSSASGDPGRANRIPHYRT